MEKLLYLRRSEERKAVLSGTKKSIAGKKDYLQYSELRVFLTSASPSVFKIHSVLFVFPICV